jgi:NAD(P)-dependent dehydrogenase (short-subunit alcohol dehydrogenase family)
METPSFRLDGRIAVVTGSGSGMGRAFAIALAQAGADVVMTELPGKEKAADETAAAVRAAGRRAMTPPLDVRQVASIRAMVERVLGEWGRIDILVNNAGMNIRKMAVEVREEDWDPVYWSTVFSGRVACHRSNGPRWPPCRCHGPGNSLRPAGAAPKAGRPHPALLRRDHFT